MSAAGLVPLLLQQPFDRSVMPRGSISPPKSGRPQRKLTAVEVGDRFERPRALQEKRQALARSRMSTISAVAVGAPMRRKRKDFEA